jgi:thioredoxin-dependent peroxiredoxin
MNLFLNSCIEEVKTGMFIETGKKLKNFRVTLTDGSVKTLKELSGKEGIVLYLYPKDNTPGCTKEACSFRDNHKDYQKRGFAVLGLSADSIESHQKFTEKQSLNFPLISDPEKEIITALGAWQEKKNYGKIYMGLVRSTFILNADLKVLKVYPKVNTATHGSDVLNDLRDE